MRKRTLRHLAAFVILTAGPRRGSARPQSDLFTITAPGQLCCGGREPIPVGAVAYTIGGQTYVATHAGVMSLADAVMTEIRYDVARGIVPESVASFAELHSYADANDYLTCVPDLPDGTFDTDTINAVTTEVDARLAAGEHR